MPIGTTCRACGAALPPDLGWCARCYTPVTTFAARPPVHEPGTYVGVPRQDVRTSRWRGSATSMGPVGRIVTTAVLFLLLPWWALALPLRSIWRKTRVHPGAPPTALDRLAERHPFLGRRLTLPSWAKLAVVALGTAGAVAIWVSMDRVDRLVWIGMLVLVVGAFVLASEHDL